MKRLKLYKISEIYIEKIREIEPKVSMLKGNRPFIGVLLEINGIPYFAPLTSPKEKHKKMKNLEDFIKIDGGNFGAINLNNMIPVPNDYYEEIIINSEELESYRNLLRNQITWCNKHKDSITLKAEKLRRKKIENSLRDDLDKRVCDFFLLEKNYKEMTKNNN